MSHVHVISVTDAHMQHVVYHVSICKSITCEMSFDWNYSILYLFCQFMRSYNTEIEIFFIKDFSNCAKSSNEVLKEKPPSAAVAG